MTNLISNLYKLKKKEHDTVVGFKKSFFLSPYLSCYLKFCETDSYFLTLAYINSVLRKERDNVSFA